MDTLNGAEVVKKRRGRPSKQVNEELASALEVENAPIPDWKNFEVKTIADINNMWNPIINLKNVKVDKKGNKYIVIEWRKYYEYSPEAPKDSMYMIKWNNLFIWDRAEWLTFRMWVTFRYFNRVGEDIEFNQTKTKYAWWVFHLQQSYKSTTYTASETLSVIRKNWRIVKVTKNMVEKYMNDPENKTLAWIIDAAKKQDPEFFAYMQSLDM